MAKFAQKTKVPISQSLTEIQKILEKYNASKFGYITEKSKAGIGFVLSNRQIKFVMLFPSKDEFKNQEAYDKEIRRLYRSLLLAIKSKLESVESGIETFEEAFMAHIVLPGGQTIGEWATPQIENTYTSGQMPPLLGHH